MVCEDDGDDDNSDDDDDSIGLELTALFMMMMMMMMELMMMLVEWEQYLLRTALLDRSRNCFLQRLLQWCLHSSAAT